jgi:tetratricopeptide (TPR) repeat protein
MKNSVKLLKSNVRVLKSSVRSFLLPALLLAACSEAPEQVTSEQRQARQHNTLGVVAMDQHNYVRGREQFETATQLDSRYAAAYANLGISLYSLGQYDSASVALQKALVVDTDHLHAAYTLGLIYHAQGRDHDRALALFHQVAERDPDDPLVRYYLGRTHAKLGQIDSAMTAFHRVIDLDSTNVSAYYALAQAQRQAGDLDGWRATLEIFSQLSQSGLEGVSAAYQGQGKYAEAMADTPFGGEFADRTQQVTFESAPAPKGMAPEAAYLTTVDADSDGQIELLTQSPQGTPILLRRSGSDFEPASSWELDGVGITSLALADVDDDGDTDAVLTATADRVALQKDGRFLSVETDFGECSRLVFGDFDHDGDADLSCAVGKAGLWSNDGAGLFKNVAAEAGIVGDGIRAMVFSDLDADRDVDLVLASATGLSLFSNNRNGTFSDVAERRRLVADQPSAIAVADLVADGSMDIAVLAKDGGQVFANDGNRFRPRQLELPAAGGLRAADLDNDGDLDLVGFGEHGINVAMSVAGVFSSTSKVSPVSTTQLVILDADDDGKLDLISPSSVEWNRSPPGGSFRVELSGLNSNPDGFGTRVEVKTAASRQIQEFRGGAGDPRVLHFGLGEETDVEFVRVLWPSGVRQTELDTVHSGEMAIAEVNRKGTSCPIVYAWDGERFEFVSDILGGAIIGYLLSPDEYYLPDTDEYLPLPRLAPTADNRFVVQIGNQLEEIIYLDGAELIAIDHPQATEMVSGERLLSAPPYPDFRGYSLLQSLPLRRAIDGEGRDVSKDLASIDDDWYDEFQLDVIHGYAREYSLILELDEAVETWNHPVLLAHGWVDYAHSSSNWAATERRLALHPPRLEARSASGSWRTVTTDMGVPAGLPKMMLYDLQDVFADGAEGLQLRITTNTPVYWDQIRIGEVDVDATPRIHRQHFSQADLHWRGYPRHEAIHGTFAFRYDYDDVDKDADWGTHGGAFTRYGQVGELVQQVDDQFVVMFHGDELTLEVDADSFPPLSQGWTRSFLLYADGFGKDMDHHSAHSLTVEPLPFHEMSRYPYGANEAYPTTVAHVDYRLNYNTRWIKGYYK